MIISLLLIFVMVLSISAAVAADDDVLAESDEITDDVLTTEVDDSSDELSEGESNVVTKDTFGNYFDTDTGYLTSDAEELVFEGDFSDLGVSAITIDDGNPVKFTGKNATFKNVQFMIMRDSVTIDGFNFVTDENNPHSKLIYIIGMDDYRSNIVLTNNNITFIAPKGEDGYAIFAGFEEAMGSYSISGLNISNNYFNYTGTTNGSTVNNVIRVNGDYTDEVSDKIYVEGNRFDIAMPSVNVYFDYTTYESTTFNEAIAFYYCDDVKFVNNNVSLRYNNHIGGYDSLYVVSLDAWMSYYTGTNANISGNKIEAVGYNYIYGIRVTQNNFYVCDNEITLSSDTNYATGINVEGPSSNGLVSRNVISLEAPTSNYGIYAWQTMGALSDISYTYNNITIDAYLACGMEINQPDPVIMYNNIVAKGNFTYGIAASIKAAGDEGKIMYNNITCLGNNEGLASGDPILKTGSAGISTLGSAEIINNNITSTSLGIVSVETGDVIIGLNQIDVAAVGDWDNYGIKVTEIDSLSMIKNNVTFSGVTNGSVITNGVYIFDTEATVQGNNFNLAIPAADIIYGPAPAYETTIINEGILIDYVDNLYFNSNVVNVTYSDVIGYYDTIRVIDIANSANVSVSENKINAKGNNYIYGIVLTGDNFTIADNVIDSSSNYYANGIDIEGPATGVIEGNNITATAPGSAYPVYSGMNGQNVSVNITGNNLIGEAFYAVGVEVGGNTVIVKENTIEVSGNFSHGIASSVDVLLVVSNNITAASSNDGDPTTVYDSMGTNSSGVQVLKGDTIIYSNNIYSNAIGVSVMNAGRVGLSKNVIEVTTIGNCDNYAVKVIESDEFVMRANNVTFSGKTNGSVITNGVYIFDTETIVNANNFDLAIPAADIIYGPAPAYETTIINEGILIDYSDNLIFENNTVKVTYSDVIGYYDTIRAIDISNSANASVSGNKINAKGNNYIYGIVLTGDNFTIADNVIDSSSNYYANGIDIEGPATGVIEGNNITATAPGSAYPVYSGMNGQTVSANITGNNIVGEAYYVVGVEVGGDKVTVNKNNINVKGNHTIGIGAYVDELIADSNTIVSDASNEGDVSIWDSMGTNTTGIEVLKGNFSITNNDIETSGEYAAVLGDNSGNVTNNQLLSNAGQGDAAVSGSGNVNMSGNPATNNKYLKVVLFSNGLTKVYGSTNQFLATILDENGQPVGNKTIKLIIDGVTYTNTSDSDGKVAFDVNFNVGEYDAVVKFDGDSAYGHKQISSTIKITKKPTAIAAAGKTVLLNTVKSGYYYTAVLKDNSGKVLANKKVTVTFNGKTSTVTTDSKGVIKYKLAAKKAASYKITIKFAGDTNYAASTATATIKLTKQATKITAKKKTFKAKKKTKKYTIVLKDSKNKAVKKVTVTIKIGKKTFKAKTNAKGKATFKIKKVTKKGTYTAKVKFAGNTYYSGKTVKVKITLKK